MKLEELARQSSASARVSVSRLEAPPIGGGTPNRSWMPILAGVTVTALVVGGLAVLARDRSDSDAAADSVLPTVAEVPRLGLELDGWSVTYASSFEDLGTRGNRPDLSYYGDADSDDPFADGDLLIAANPGADPSSRPPEAPGGETVELRGTEATVSSATDLGLPTDATSVTWYESNVDGTATEIIVVSRSYDVARLIAIAEALTIDGDTVTPGDNLELDRLAIAAGTPFDVFSGSDDGNLVGYTNEPSSDFVVISSTRGSLDQASDVMSWWTGDVVAVEVDGRPGFLATFDESMPDLGPMVSWSPVDGVVTTLSHLGTDDSLDLVALAGTAYEIDDATWAGYLTATEAIGTGADQFDEIFGEGDGTLGETEYSWVLGLQDDNLCFDLQTGNESNGSCQQRGPIDVPPGGARTIDNSFGSVLATVVIAADPAVEQVIATPGYDITRVEADGLSWFVAIGDPNIQPSFDVIVDGTVVATLEAAVEAVVDMEPSLASNPAATELGIADMTILAADDTGAGFSWWLGSIGPDLCLVTDGANPTARCSTTGDIVAFAPVAAPDNELTFVVVVDAPSCVAGISFDGPTVEFSAGAADELHTYEIFGIIDNSDTAKLRFEGGGASQPVDLPGFEGTATFPPQLCNG
jgi:hypothetical protein